MPARTRLTGTTICPHARPPLPHRAPRLVTTEVPPATLAPDGGIAVVESQLLVVTSDTVLRRAIVAAHLDTDPEFGGSPAGFAGAMRNKLAGLGIDLDAGD